MQKQQGEQQLPSAWAGCEGEDVEPVEHEHVEFPGARFRGRETGRCSKCNQGGPAVMQSVWSQTLETPTIV